MPKKNVTGKRVLPGVYKVPQLKADIDDTIAASKKHPDVGRVVQMRVHDVVMTVRIEAAPAGYRWNDAQGRWVKDEPTILDAKPGTERYTFKCGACEHTHAMDTYPIAQLAQGESVIFNGCACGQRLRLNPDLLPERD